MYYDSVACSSWSPTLTVDYDYYWDYFTLQLNKLIFLGKRRKE